MLFDVFHRIFDPAQLREHSGSHFARGPHRCLANAATEPEPGKCETARTTCFLLSQLLSFLVRRQIQIQIQIQSWNIILSVSVIIQELSSFASFRRGLLSLLVACIPQRSNCCDALYCGAQLIRLIGSHHHHHHGTNAAPAENRPFVAQRGPTTKLDERCFHN